jgi:hypothetical protein
MTKPNMKQRIAWIIPNVLMYFFFFGLSVFVFANAEGLDDINRLGITFQRTTFYSTNGYDS